MWPDVHPEDIENRWRPLSMTERQVADTRIGDAIAELQTRLADGGVTTAPAGDNWAVLYVATVVEMVRRYLLNVDGWSSETESIDDYSVTKRRDSGEPTGSMYVTDDEIAKLLPRERRRRGAFSIRLGNS